MKTYKEVFANTFFFQTVLCFIFIGMLMVTHITAGQIKLYNEAKNDKGEYIVFVTNLNEEGNGILEAQVWDSNREPRDYKIEESFCEGKVWEAEMKYGQTYQFVCPYPTFENVNEDKTSAAWTIAWVICFVGSIFMVAFFICLTITKAYEVSSLKSQCRERLGVD